MVFLNIDHFSRVSKWSYVLSIIIPMIMTISINYPISDFIHGPYHHCAGRFEVYFNPTHPDPFTPGRREGEKHCDPTYVWAMESEINSFTTIFRFSLFSLCKFTTILYWLVTFCIPEMILYPLTFRYIIQQTNNTAQAGILMPEAVKRRRQQTSLNIYVTLVSCIAQLLANIMFLILMIRFFGMSKFYHSLFAIVMTSFNFNFLPIFYVFMTDDRLKKAIQEKKYFVEILEVFFTS